MLQIPVYLSILTHKNPSFTLHLVLFIETLILSPIMGKTTPKYSFFKKYFYLDPSELGCRRAVFVFHLTIIKVMNLKIRAVGTEHPTESKRKSRAVKSRASDEEGERGPHFALLADLCGTEHNRARSLCLYTS